MVFRNVSPDTPFALQMSMTANVVFRNVFHLDLRPGDMVLVRLGSNKTPEKEKYRVIRVKGNEITAVSIKTGRVLRRHLSRFTRILERPQQPQVPQQNIEEDHDRMPLPSGAQAPPLPPAPQNVRIEMTCHHQH